MSERNPAGGCSRFTLLIPALEIDGQTFRLEPIVFRYRRHDWAVYPFNCRVDAPGRDAARPRRADYAS